MVVHAINLVDPNNWREVSVELPDGTQKRITSTWRRSGRSAPCTSAGSRAGQAGGRQHKSALGVVLENPSRSSPKFAAAAVEWAQSATATPKNEDEDDGRMREQAVVTAAMIAMRDGDAELRARHAEWARSVFAQALQTKEDPVHRFRSGLRFNPIAIAFAGMIHSLKDRATPVDMRALLEVAARDNPAAAHGFGATAITLASIDERLPRAVLRCAFAACIRPSREWNLPEEEVAARSERHRQRVQAAVDAELAWLGGERAEPNWPAFPTSSGATPATHSNPADGT